MRQVRVRRAPACRVAAAALGATLTLSFSAASLSAAHAFATARPRAVMILIDVNVSPPADRLPQERQAALAYARALPPDVKTGLIEFSAAWKIVLPPTIDRAALARALAALQPAGATSDGIRSAMVGALAELHQIGAAPARLLVLSNGEYLNHQVLAVDNPTDVVSWSHDVDDFPAQVRQLASTSGGHVAAPAAVAALAALFPRLHPARPTVRPSRTAAVTPVRAGSVASPVSDSLLVTLAAVFAAFFLVALLGIGSLRRGDRRPQLASQFERYGPAGKTPAAPAQEGEGMLAQSAIGFMSAILGARGSAPRLAMRLDRAGISRLPAEWALLGVCTAVVLSAAFTVIFGNVFAGVLIGALTGWITMRLILSLKIDRRRRAFDEQLPNILQQVAGSLQTGFSLAQAIDAVVREGSQPAAAEFSRALAESTLGVDISDALNGVAERLQSSDLSWVVIAVKIQRETGGNLADVIRTTVGTMRERAFLRRQVRSLSAEGRLSAVILLALPVLVGGWLFYSSPTYMRPLYSTTIGLTMLTVSVLLLIAGAFWMRSLINVEA